MRNSVKLLALSSAAVLGLVGCSSNDDEHDSPAGSASNAAEHETAQPRLVLTYDGGVTVVDATTLEKVADVPVEGFTRVNEAGDGRYAFVSTSDGFRLLDVGTWTEAHGDHGHSYTAAPKFTDIDYTGEKPGHVVLHDDKTVLFTDGTGAVRILDPKKLGTEDAVASEFTVPAHHGVAVARADGSVVVSKGDSETRTGAFIRDASGKTVAENDECPGLHGEAAGKDGVITFGCEDGILMVKGDRFTKIKAAAPYARIGNQAGSDASPIILGDYKTDKDAELERPRKFSLTDTRTGTIRVVDIDTTYSFRSLGRGPNGEALILGADGKLHVFDPETGKETAAYQLIAPWTEPDDWKDPMPDLHVIGSTVYITEPAKQRVLAVSLHDGKVLTEKSTGKANMEMTGVTG
ncbi:MAG: hypothetical protein QM809_12225 [Gordonia sp. (in: high G+C Gram-positive bacteria)]|uniref:hypothetical protein n=1 Tax=Gordonia sp. (in: high G+C Gram-positive bacteria) TaxID=84139 RepID=UPI0039E6DBDB